MVSIDIACLELSDWSFLYFHVTCIIHMTQHHFCKVGTIFHVIDLLCSIIHPSSITTLCIPSTKEILSVVST